MSRMVSTQQANRRHEDNLRQLEDQLSAERVRVHNKLWEDTQKLQDDLIRLRIRTPNTTHTRRESCCRPGFLKSPLTDSHVVGRGGDTDKLKLVTESEQVLGKETYEADSTNDKKCMRLLCSGNTRATKNVTIVGERKHSDRVGNVLLHPPDQHVDRNAYNPRDGSDVSSRPKYESFKTKNGYNLKQIPGVPSRGRKQNGSLVSQEHQNPKPSSMAENQQIPTLRETHQKNPNNKTVVNGLDSNQEKKLDALYEQQGEVFETSGKETIFSEMNSLLHTDTFSFSQLPTALDNGRLNTVDGNGETHLRICDLLAPVTRHVRHVTKEEPNYQSHNFVRKDTTASSTAEGQQTALQARREAIRKHQQSVLPTVQVCGDNVQYFYQGLPGHSKTFTPDSRTQTLLRRNSQIGNTLQYLDHKKNSYLYQLSSQKQHDETTDSNAVCEDDESKNQSESLIHGWPQVATKRRKLIWQKQRKAKIKSLMTMKSMKSSTLPDLEDESLPGWRLLKLFKLWNKDTDRPAWASSSYLRRKHQENEHHQNRQQRHTATNVQTKVLEAMSAGTSRKPHPKTGLKMGSTAKTWLKKAKQAKPNCSGLPRQKCSNKTCNFVYRVSSVPNPGNDTLPESAHPVQKGTDRNASRGIKRVGSDKLMCGKDWEYRGRKVEVGREHRMWVGNLSLSTGLTGTVATSRRHPDVLVRKDH